MMYWNLQSYVQGLLAANSAIAALAPSGAILIDPFRDQETARSLIDEALRQYGVAIEIGFPTAHNMESKLDGTTAADLHFDVWVGESLEVAHSPNRLVLKNEVILALTKPNGLPGIKPARLLEDDSVKTERGYLLHAFKCFIPMLIKQSSTVVGKDFNSDFGPDFK